MNPTLPRGTLLDLPLIEERYGWAFCVALALHGLLAALFLIAPLLMPRQSIVQLGTGPGAGRAGDSYTVGVTDEPGGGAGLFKPATTPQPPVLPAEKAAKKEEPAKAVPLPDTLSPKNRKKAAEESTKTSKSAPNATSTQIPVADAKGTGAAGSGSRGSGSVTGTGVGVSIGSGSGGIGDSWYARTVEARVGGNWTKPIGLQQRIEIIYSFMVGDDGRIYDIKLEKSSGNEALDLSAERAIRASNPLTVPPPELRGKLLQFTAVFVYPQDK
jgi:TonB family protein